MSSDVLARTEVVRAVSRADPDAVHLAVDLLAAVSVVELDMSLADQAAQLEPAELRTLDALHTAAALRLGPALGFMISYDERMLDAARRHGRRCRASGLDTHSTRSLVVSRPERVPTRRLTRPNGT